MKALILVGGYGTRLRPLTLTLPKPMVEFCNKPILQHQIEALANCGVTEVILAINFQPKALEPMKDMAANIGIKLTYSQELEPLGTAGPIALAQPLLEANCDDDLFFVLNSDVVCEYPLKDMIDQHRKSKKICSVLATKVEEPSRYGVINCDPEGKIFRYVEKPHSYVGNLVNGGIYLFDKRIFEWVEPHPSSLETEVFPWLAESNELRAFTYDGFWRDVGQPKDYLAGMCALLDHVRKVRPRLLARGPHVVGNVLIDPTARIGEDCVIGPNVTIGPGVVLEDGVRLKRTAVLEGTVIKSHAWVHSSIIGWQSTIGRWARVEGTSVVGQDVQVRDEVYINGGLILPHKSIISNVPEPTIVM